MAVWIESDAKREWGDDELEDEVVADLNVSIKNEINIHNNEQMANSLINNIDNECSSSFNEEKMSRRGYVE